MRKTTLFLLCLLMTVVSPFLYHSLTEGIILKQGDELVSTLGLYKLSLISKDCSLNFYMFKDASQSYQPLNLKYSGNYQGSCKSLAINKNVVTTESGKTFISLISNNFSQTYLIIDDTGVIRFIGIKKATVGLASVDYEQIKFSNYSKPNQYVAILQSFQKISDKFPAPVTTTNNWIFYLTQSSITISNTLNSLTQTFNLPTAYFSVSGIFNENNLTLPDAVFQGIIFSNLCGHGKKQLKGPFVVEISQQWPVMRVYDQEGYKLFEYGLGNLVGTYNPCPSGLFHLKSNCLATCPTSYFSQLIGSKGQCKLVCQSDSLYDSSTKICRCPNHFFESYKFSCVNTTSYPFGCFCSNKTYLNASTQRCVSSCSIGFIGLEGLCLSCGQNCQNCTASSNNTSLLTCNSCKIGFTLNKSICVQSSSSCSPNCLQCISNICYACAPLYSLLNNFCIQACPTGTQIAVETNMSSYCRTTVVGQCPQGCLKCTNTSLCLVCQPAYTLLLSPVSSTCVRNTIFFSCSSPNYANLNNVICYSNDNSSLSTLSKCATAIQNCFLCLFQSTSVCVSCQPGSFLQQNVCVRSCSLGYYQVNQACLKSITNCKKTNFLQGRFNTSFNLNTVTQNQPYLQLINQGKSQLNEPYGYQLYTKRYYSLINDYSDISAVLYWATPVCSQCEQGYGLAIDKLSCAPCPKDCLLCLNSYDDSCIAKTMNQLMLYSLGQQIASCRGFIRQNSICSQSCPANTLPTFNTTYNKLQCKVQPQQQSSNHDNYLQVDGGSFKVADNKYIHKFVFSQPLKHPNLTLGRLLQTNNAELSSDGSTIIMESSFQTSILNLSGVVQSYQSVNDAYPVNSVYGISVKTSFRSYLSQGYAYIGYFFSIFIILTHCIFVGNGIMYKKDNLIIFSQSIFYFLFVRVLISNPVGQFYYGWNWMHIGFWPNYFNNLIEGTAFTAPPYALYNLDASFVRNAGFSLSLLFTFLIAWIVICVSCYLIEAKLSREQVWFKKISKNSLLAFIELVSFNIFYWAVAHSHYDSQGSAKDTEAGLTAMCIIAIIAYTCIRTYFQRIGGVYMVKRIVYSSILGSSYDKKGYVAILIFFQIGFTVFRWLWEKPASKKDKCYMLTEQAGIIFGFMLLYLSDSVIPVSYLITLFVYVWFLTLVVDLVDIYLLAKNKLLQRTWLPCFQERQLSSQQVNSSKQDIKAGTDRPFYSNVSK